MSVVRPVCALMAISIVVAALSALPAQSGKGGSGGSVGSGKAGSSSSPGGGSSGQSGNSGNSAGGGSRGDSGAQAAAPSPDPVKSLETWIAKDRKAAIDGAPPAEILEIFMPVLKDGLPPGLVRQRIQEASSKKIQAEQALSAFRRDAASFAFLLELSKGAKWPPSADAEAFYSAAASALRNGMERKAVETVFSLATMSKLDPRRAGASLAAASAFRAEHRLTEEDTASLAGALAASRIAAKKVSSVLSLAAKARTAGLESGEILIRIMASLRAGGTVTDVEKALKAP